MPRARRGSEESSDPGRRRLLEACREGECPVCRHEAAAAKKRLEALLHEQVTDPETRARVRRSHGFCPAHTWLLADLPQGNLAVAVIYRQLLTDALDHLDARGVRPEPVARLFRRPAEKPRLTRWHGAKQSCPLCREAAEVSAADLRIILDEFASGAFRDRFGRSAGLCLPHLARAAELHPSHANLPALLEWHGSRWRDLAAELEEFTRKFDYRYTDEAMGEERDSWLRVLRLFAGARR